MFIHPQKYWKGVTALADQNILGQETKGEGTKIEKALKESAVALWTHLLLQVEAGI